MGKVILSHGAGTESSDCTAVRSQVLAGYTAMTKDSDDEAVTGTMVNHTGKVTKCNNIWWGKDGDSLAVAVDQGYYECWWDGNSYEYIDGNTLRSALGVANWKFRSDQWIAGIKGSIPIQGANVPGTTDRAYATASANWAGTVNVGIRNEHFFTGVNWIQYDMPNYYPQNIKKGVNMGGVIGTFEGYVPTANDLYLRGNNVKAFQSNTSYIILYQDHIQINDTASDKDFAATVQSDFNNHNALYVQGEFCNGATRGRILTIYLISGSEWYTLGTHVFPNGCTGLTTFGLPLPAGLGNRILRFSFGASITGNIYRIWLE